jgi:cell division protein FtsW
MAGKKIDFSILGPVLILLCLGLLIIFSISAATAEEKCGNTYCFVKHQLIFGLLPGLILAFLAYRSETSFLKKISLLLFVLNIALLAAVFAPNIGAVRGGSRRWLTLGQFSFQPSEFLKITLPLYLASWLSSPNFLAKKDFSFLAKYIAILSLPSLIILFQPDLSTLAIILFVAFLMYFWSKTPFWHFLLILAIGLVGIIVLTIVAPYRLQRFLVFTHPQLDPMGMGYQAKQALIAIGSGGIFGNGLGMSRQKFGFLPYPMSDSNFAIFCEEGGFLGAAALIVLFLTLSLRGIRIAKESKDEFSGLLAAAISAQIVFQAFLNMGAMLSLVPLTGIPLPFISYGGTHLMVELVMVGLLLNISRRT